MQTSESRAIICGKTRFLFPRLYFGSDVSQAVLRRPPPQPCQVLGQRCWALWLSQRRAGRQLGVRLRVRVLGEAERRGLGWAGLSFHRENGDCREGEDESVCLWIVVCKCLREIFEASEARCSFSVSR